MTTNLPRTILVATDFSDTSESAVEYAVALATRLDAKLYLLNVIGVPSYGVPMFGGGVDVPAIPPLLDAVAADSQLALEQIIKSYAPSTVEPLLRHGDPRDVIVQTAVEIGADLIVMGTHGRRGVKRALLGSVAEGVLRNAHCPVLTIRGRG